MAPKPDKAKKTSGKTNHEPGNDSSKKPSTKSKKQLEEDDDDLDEDEEIETPATKKGKTSATSKTKSKKDEDDEDEDGVADTTGDEVDDWDKVEEEEEWDPDFEEFDIPKSKGKKAGTGGVAKKRAAAEEEEDFKLDDEFKDMDLFNDKGFDDDEEDDY